jgi:hypothetical protein
MRKLFCAVTATLVLIGPLSLLRAEPLIWEADLGTELIPLTGEDDEAVYTLMSFSFPFGGSSYSSLYVGTNGAVGLGGLGEAGSYPSGDEFSDTTAAMIAPFWSDMSLASIGKVYGKLFAGDKAVFTWDGIGTYENDTLPYTFQLQMYNDGKIIFGYNGIPSLDSLDIDTDVHVGLTQGGGVTVPPEVDYSADAPFFSGDTVIELFEVDSVFDLDQKNVIFTPQAGGGYLVTVPEPCAIALLGMAALAVTLGWRKTRKR